jgi:hypothetical protein
LAIADVFVNSELNCAPTPVDNTGMSDNRVAAPLWWRMCDLLALLIQYALPWIGLAVGLYLFRDAVRQLFNESDSPIWIGLMTNINRTRAFAFIFGFLGVFYGLQERNLRHSAVTRLRQRIAELERELQARQRAE